MIEKPLDSICEADILDLIKNQTPESARLDYEAQLPGKDDKSKYEFQTDVTSFANTVGGLLIYGIEESPNDNGQSTGLPGEIKPIPTETLDNEILRLENLLRNGIEPRIHGVNIRGIPVVGGTVVLVRVPQNFAAPHAVKNGANLKFYARHSVGKHPMDVQQVRTAFSLSERLPERIRNFRIDSAAKIMGGMSPLGVAPTGGIVLLHVVPLSAFGPGPSIGLPNDVREYVQLFRNGAIEFVNAERLAAHNRQLGQSTLPAQPIAQCAIDLLKRCLRWLCSQGAASPVLVMLSMLGVRGYKVTSPSRFDGGPAHWAIDRDDLYFPEHIVDNLGEPAEKILRPIFDQLWQAAGHPKCPHYADDHWQPQK